MFPPPQDIISGFYLFLYINVNVLTNKIYHLSNLLGTGLLADGNYYC